ncbi:hypothetical protein LA080_011498 [Diaporthe eres]|nr:hypothetical protein LA080_011498 [Diaporthe eres]
MVMPCLVLYGANQPVIYPNTAPLSNVMTMGGRGRLRDGANITQPDTSILEGSGIQIHDSSQSFSDNSTKSVRGGVKATPLCGLEDIPIYELEDTSARRLMRLKAQKSCIAPRFRLPLSEYHSRIRGPSQRKG